MSPIAPALQALSRRIAELTALLGHPVDVGELNATDRAGFLNLGEPGLWSPNRACRLFRAADGWIAVNLAREEDRELVPAWLLCDVGDDAWAAIARVAPERACAELLEQAILLGLPVARVGEVVESRLEPPSWRPGKPGLGDSARRLRAVDLSALWAGPLCGAVLAALGADVIKVESARRSDPTRATMPEFFNRLNGQKRELQLDLATAAGQARLRDEIAAADVLITSVRPRGLASVGLSVERTFEENPRLTWAAITGYGWGEATAARVAFGDDAAAAGGLVRWTREREPRFLGDALSDPVTGLAAAAGALAAVIAGGGVLIDVAMARCAAAAASVSGILVAT
jgi:hypothetical protein